LGATAKETIRFIFLRIEGQIYEKSWIILISVVLLHPSILLLNVMDIIIYGTAKLGL